TNAPFVRRVVRPGMEKAMSRTASRAASVFFLVLLVLAGYRVVGHTQAAAQTRAARPAATTPGAFLASTKNGDWPSYTGDTRGSRYPPLPPNPAQNFTHPDT